MDDFFHLLFVLCLYSTWSLLLVGDSNHPTINWDDLDVSSDVEAFLDYVQSLCQHVTREKNCLFCLTIYKWLRT